MKSVLIVCLISLALYSLIESYPLHASCKVSWTWPNFPCKSVHDSIIQQINEWTTDDNCKNGGEKCLYALVSQTTTSIKATHTTPVKKYVDDLTFTFNQNGGNCEVQGYSTSETWYAVLDFGTNYCNLNNLITGAQLDKIKGYSEVTNDSICTQYSSANCTIY